jgi:transcriptional regulator with XRE-family HTH domain
VSPVRTPASPGTPAPDGVMTVAEVVGDRIRHYRHRKGWRQVDLVGTLADLGLSWTRQTITYVENGARTLTTPELVAVALALRVSVDELLDPPVSQRMALRATWAWLTLDGDDMGAILGDRERAASAS